MTTAEQLSRQIAAVVAETTANVLRPVRQRIARLEHAQRQREKRTIPRGQEAEYARRQQVADRLAQARERDGD